MQLIELVDDVLSVWRIWCEIESNIYTSVWVSISAQKRLFWRVFGAQISQVPKIEVLNLIRLLLGVGLPLRKPYIQLLGEDFSILGT